MTGLPCSGKTTIAKRIIELMPHLDIDHLDGDIVRKSFTADLGFSKEDRDENIRRVSYVASYLSHIEDKIVICTFVSPYKEARDKVRNMCENFVEVHVDADIAVCEKRDVKGMYALARSGVIKDFTGVSDPYESPMTPEMRVFTDTYTVDECAHIIINNMGWV